MNDPCRFPAGVVDGHAATIGSRAVDEESARRHHIVVTLTGAHAYGFPSADSDLDLKAIHVLPTTALLGFAPPPTTHDRAEILEGVEIDYTSNELGPALAGILKGNGNFLERVLAHHRLVEDPLLAPLADLARRSVSRRVHRHYRGFAWSQLQEFERAGSAKRCLYVLRTTMTGTHALRTGEIVPDLTAVGPLYGFGDLDELLAIKRSGERAPLPDALRLHWRLRLDTAFAELERALAESPLPEDPPTEGEAEDWLKATRRGLL